MLFFSCWDAGIKLVSFAIFGMPRCLVGFCWRSHWCVLKCIAGHYNAMDGVFAISCIKGFLYLLCSACRLPVLTECSKQSQHLLSWDYTALSLGVSSGATLGTCDNSICNASLGRKPCWAPLIPSCVTLSSCSTTS